METEAQRVERRLEALEVELGRSRRAARSALAVAAVSALLAVAALSRGSASPSDGPAPAAAPGPASAPPAATANLEVQRLLLVDAQGQARATLGVSANGAVALTLSAPDGSPRLVLQAQDQRAGLSALGPGGRNRAWLGWGYSEAQGDHAELQLLDQRGQPRLSATASDAAPGLTFYNDAGVPADSLPE